MESVYVMTGRAIWRDMTKFWGKLFGINFAMGVATGITMEFQFGTNWAYYSHYVGDIFGAPLAIEGLMAFFLESTFVGLFFFGWDRLSQGRTLVVTWLVAFGSNLSALWILIANGWMQNPVGAQFNLDTMRMELTDFSDVVFNPVAQAKFVHTVSAGYVTGVDVRAGDQRLIICCAGAHIAIREALDDGRRQLRPGLGAVGRRAGRRERLHRRAEPENENRGDRGDVAYRAGAGGFHRLRPSRRKAHEATRFEIKLPWLLGLIATRSIDQQVPGIEELVAEAQDAHPQRHHRVRGAAAICAMTATMPPLRAQFDAHARRSRLRAAAETLRPTIANANDAQIRRPPQTRCPTCRRCSGASASWSGFGFYFIALFAYAFWLASRASACSTTAGS